MAQVQMTVHIQVRWWVWIYLATAVLFVRCMAAWVDEDDADAMAENVADFILRHGIRFSDGS